MHIEMKSVALKYGEKDMMFEDVNLTISGGEFLLIQGASGTGKSSLLRLLNRLQEPTTGEILVDDKKISDWDVMGLRRSIGYVQQTPIMNAGTVRENLVLPFQYKSAQGEAALDDGDLEKWMDEFLLSGVTLGDKAEELSVGQKQRVALIRTMLTEPAIVLCDEPTSALDPDSKGIVEGWLERINIEQGVGVVLVTHIDFEPQNVTPRRFVLSRDGLKET